MLGARGTADWAQDLATTAKLELLCECMTARLEIADELQELSLDQLRCVARLIRAYKAGLPRD